MTPACKVANSQLFYFVTVADVYDDHDRIGFSLLQIWKLRFRLIRSIRLIRLEFIGGHWRLTQIKLRPVQFIQSYMSDGWMGWMDGGDWIL